MKALFRQLLRSLITLAVVTVLGPKAAYSQPITPAADTATTIASPASNPNQFDITGGIRVGGNLFHSFQQFDLSQGQIANFLSNPGLQSILGRVVGGNATIINGLVQVSGGKSNLFLMNPAGIIFGPKARLNLAGSFTATTADGIRLGNSWFSAIGPNIYANLVGELDRVAFLGTNSGAILNAGILRAGEGQNITLLGGTVVNTGTIEAPGGTITIAAVSGKNMVRISQEGTLLGLELPIQSNMSLSTPNIQPLSLPALLTGGSVPEATGLSVENGVVKLTHSGKLVSTTVGAATISGDLTVNTATLQKTVKIQVLGDRVSLLNANLNASSANGGGTVLIGGDYQGAGIVPKARFTEIDHKTMIRADAIAALPNGTGGTGNGGTVIVWSTDTTEFAGTITAQGGSNGGNGGLVETSSQQTLVVAPSASVSTRAVQGQTGTWLLDPPDLTVMITGLATTAGSSPLTNTPITATTISPAAIVSGLNGNNVNLQASNSLTVNAAIDASTNPAAGNLTLTAPTTTLNQPITLAPGSTLNGTATNVKVNAGGIIQNGVDVAAAGATVNVAAGTFNVPGATNQVSLTKAVTVKGAGAGSTIVDGGGNSRGFYIDPGAGNTVSLEGLTIEHSYIGGNGAGLLVNSGTVNLSNIAVSQNRASGDGGGIYNGGTLTLNNSTLSGNAASGKGGGIYNQGDYSSRSSLYGSYMYPYSYNYTVYSGVLAISGSTFSGNWANSGGGIYNGGMLTLTNSTLSGNAASSKGGGIYNQGADYSDSFNQFGYYAGNGMYSLSYGSTSTGYGALTISSSTLSGNWADSGGGIYNGGMLTFTNSTLSGNTASGDGGGIYNRGGYSSHFGGFGWASFNSVDNGGVLDISNSTIASNAARNGGGIYNEENRIFYLATQPGDLTVRNSLVVGNMAELGREVANLGTGRSEGYNLFGYSGSSGVEGIVFNETDLVPSIAIDRILAPLRNNGGFTQTHALILDSPAINTGDPNLTTFDQRGFARVDRSDIGAFEFRGVNPLSMALPTFLMSESESSKLMAVLYGRENTPLSLSIQPELTKPLLCIVSTQDGEGQTIHTYHGLPECLTQ